MIGSILVVSLWNNAENCSFCVLTQPILIKYQFREWGVKEHQTLHNLRIYHIVIRSGVKYSIAAKDLISQQSGTGQITVGSVAFRFFIGWNPLQWIRLGSNPHPDLNCKFGTIANTTLSPSLGSLHHDLEVNIHTCSIMVSMFTQAWYPSPSPNLEDYCLQVRMIMTSKSICKLARLWPPCLHYHGHQSETPQSLNHGLQVHLWAHLIVIFRCNPNCSQALLAACPDIPSRWVAI